MTLPDFARLAAWAVAGSFLAAAYLNLLARTVAALQRPIEVRSAAAWILLRAALAVAVFAAASIQGAAPLIATLAGFLTLRTVILTWVQRC